MVLLPTVVTVSVSSAFWRGCVLVIPSVTALCTPVSLDVARLKCTDIVDKIYRYVTFQFIPDLTSAVMIMISNINYESKQSSSSTLLVTIFPTGSLGVSARICRL